MFTNFRFILAIRFLGYALFFLGLLGIFFVLGPLVQVEANYRLDNIRGVKRTISNNIVISQNEKGKATSKFGDIKPSENSIIPLSTDYGIVIEKINANAKIIPNVNPADEKQYSQALTQGVAEALGSTKPGENGNLYLFSHSVDAPWNIIRFNAVFFLLRELEKGDRIVLFYQNKRFDYIVFDKIVAEPSDISFLTNRYDSPVLTLQTCDPPGTLMRRLIVRAKLVSN
jgi:LPXTG-site transpeptidase (sortase) family protein